VGPHLSIQTSSHQLNLGRLHQRLQTFHHAVCLRVPRWQHCAMPGTQQASHSHCGMCSQAATEAATEAEGKHRGVWGKLVRMPTRVGGVSKLLLHSCAVSSTCSHQNKRKEQSSISIRSFTGHGATYAVCWVCIACNTLAPHAWTTHWLSNGATAWFSVWGAMCGSLSVCP
jgi:hypothetical protein